VRRLGCVFAHPDDETFTSGGTIAKLGIPVSSRIELGTRRRMELTAASRILGIASLSTPGHGDGVLHEVDPERLIGEVVFFIRRYRPEVVVTFGPEGAPTRHRDHRAISRAATAAFFLAGLATEYADQLREVEPSAPARLYYCAWDPPAPDAELKALSMPVTCRVPVADFLDIKRQAFLAHATQREHEARFQELTMLPAERFALAAGVPQPRAVTESLFEGL
jgi:LmbE family N-acetylglucosaminyl deacetylase